MSVSFVKTSKGNVHILDGGGLILHILHGSAIVHKSVDDPANVIIISDSNNPQKKNQELFFNIAIITSPSFSDIDDLLTQLSDDFFFLISSPYPEVDVFASLPDPTTQAGVIYVVQAGSGVWLFTRKPAGLYRSDGIVWTHLSAFPDSFNDANFRVYNSGDETKQMDVDASGIATSSIRTLIMPDRDVNLGGAGDPFVALTELATTIWDWEDGINRTLTLTADSILQIDNPIDGVVGILKVIQDSTGGWELTLPGNSIVRDNGAGVIVLSPNGDEVDMLAAIYDGTDFVWTYNLAFT